MAFCMHFEHILLQMRSSTPVNTAIKLLLHLVFTDVYPTDSEISIVPPLVTPEGRKSTRINFSFVNGRGLTQFLVIL